MYPAEHEIHCPLVLLQTAQPFIKQLAQVFFPEAAHWPTRQGEQVALPEFQLFPAKQLIHISTVSLHILQPLTIDVQSVHWVDPPMLLNWVILHHWHYFDALL